MVRDHANGGSSDTGARGSDEPRTGFSGASKVTSAIGGVSVEVIQVRQRLRRG